jgi:Undecaprenyl-phosphate glucose phosphotransferase
MWMNRAIIDGYQAHFTLVPALVTLLFVSLQFARGAYNPQAYMNMSASVRATLLCWLAAFIAVAGIHYLLQLEAGISRAAFAASFFTGLALLPLARVGVAQFPGAVAREGRVMRSAYMIGEEEDPSMAAIARSAERDGVRMIGFGTLPPTQDAQSFKEACAALAADMRATLARSDFNEIYVRIPWEHKAQLQTLAAMLSQFPARVLLLADPDFPPLNRANTVTIGGHRAIELRSAPISSQGLIAKRALDIAVAGTALLALMPLLAMAAAAIAIESGRPIIFRQNRRGVCGRPFTILKFRTMSVQENGDTVVQAQRNDPRITRLGAIYRKTSIDELPQLVNVLRGDMSIVGPRPHAVAHDDYYGKLIEEYACRHNVKPGLTGWAQVNGFRGETRDLHSMAERVRHDVWYIENWSLWLDVRIIVKTAMCVLFQKQAY